MYQEKTLVELFEKKAEQFPGNVFIRQNLHGKYESTDYEGMNVRIKQLSAALIEKGIQKGDRVSIISEGSRDWIVAELAAFYCGAINVPISVKIDEASDLIFRLDHSSAKIVFVSASQAAKVIAIKDKVSSIEHIVRIGKQDNRKSAETSIDEWFESGKNASESIWQELSERMDKLQADDVVNICYTSGTTADPKGIMLTHRNYLCNALQATEVFYIPEFYTSLMILPWDHSFAHTVGIYTLVMNAASLASVQVGKTAMETLRNIPGNIKEIKPYFLLSVPALAKNFRANIEKGIKQKGKFTWSLFRMGLKTAYSYNGIGFNKGKGLTFILKPLVWLFDKILFSKIRGNFGGRLLFFVGGGALLDIELQRFFYAIGIPMYQGYGLTEASPVISSNTPDDHKMGSSGKPVPFMEIMICDEDGNKLPAGEKGEIVIKGDNVMHGYWKNEEATKETIRDGWLYSGDMGYLDSDGYLYVLGRFKSLLIANDGEKYSPEGMEEAFMAQSDFFDDLMLYNNQNPYTVCLLHLQKGKIKSWAEENHIDLQEEAGLLKVLHKIREEFNAYQRGGSFDGQFPKRWLPAAFHILIEGFTEDNRLRNSTMKIVRAKITERYQNEIQFLYTTDGKEIENTKNIENLKKILS